MLKYRRVCRLAVYILCGAWLFIFCVEPGCLYSVWSLAVYILCGAWLFIFCVEPGCLYSVWSLAVYILCGAWLFIFCVEPVGLLLLSPFVLGVIQCDGLFIVSPKFYFSVFSSRYRTMLCFFWS